MIVCGMDPAIKNFGVSAIKFTIRKGHITCRVLWAGMMINTLVVIKDYQNVIPAVYKEWSSYVHAYKLDAIIAERYMNRGMCRGNQVETVSWLLGYLTGRIQRNIDLVPAVSWKNAVNRELATKGKNLKDFYKWCKPATPHVADATLIALYYAYKHKGIKPYSNLNWSALRREIQNGQLPIQQTM